jgi:hypothetical protein
MSKSTFVLRKQFIEHFSILYMIFYIEKASGFQVESNHYFPVQLKVKRKNWEHRSVPRETAGVTAGENAK